MQATPRRNSKRRSGQRLQQRHEIASGNGRRQGMDLENERLAFTAQVEVDMGARGKGKQIIVFDYTKK